ncbi:MAG TPA: ADP-forming succinate--CoA ligase subunit beta [Clostridiales bacterium]|nr:ADP-forming succinate--CoA ligase subunit beta [Clostridiales bacterium]
MDLMEYKVRELYEKCGVPTKKGYVIDSLDELPAHAAELAYPLVVKAQVQTGGRGKAGGIKFAENRDELQAACRSILGMDIRGHLVRKLMIAEKAAISREWYLSIILDRLSKGPMIIFSPLGGMDIEETARTTPEKVLKVPVDPLLGIQDFQARYLLSKSGLDLQQTSALYDLLQKLYVLFRTYDCTLVEINPLALQDDGSLLALDGKVTVDDSALFRQPEILAFRDTLVEDERILEARRFNFLYIPCDPAGSIAVMSNGSGLIMSCIDLISKENLRVGAALDLGGGATADRIAQAIRIILTDLRIKALFINIFGGITRCDEVAGGVQQACASMDGNRLIIVRFEGTNKEKGMQILNSLAGQVAAVDGLQEGVRVLAARRDEL